MRDCIRWFKCKLKAPNKIMDTVEELEQVVHRVCRVKQRRLEFQPNLGTTQMYQQLQPMQQGTKCRNILC